jgi:hypothetical protein
LLKKLGCPNSRAATVTSVIARPAVTITNTTAAAPKIIFQLLKRLDDNITPPRSQDRRECPAALNASQVEALGTEVVFECSSLIVIPLNYSVPQEPVQLSETL